VWGQSGAEADVRVDVRAGIVAIQVEHTRVGPVVPVAAAKGQATNITTYPL